jgi:predicted glycosyltransferase
MVNHGHHRYLFQARNRRGLGHMMRGLNIAQALRALDARARICFHVSAAPAPGFWPEGIDCRVERPGEPETRWQAMLAHEAPDVVVYDTMLPDDSEMFPTATTRQAFVMRKCLPDEQRVVYAHPALRTMRTILIPHTPEEFGAPPPAHIAARCRFVGPIVRATDAGAKKALRAKYELGRGDFVLVSTVGGGGFEAQADQFFRTVTRVHAAVRALPGPGRFRHLVVLGPNYAGSLVAMPDMTVIGFEPDLVNLLACADLVIAEGGYNTVNEILLTQVPALFLPSVRGKDNQLERVAAVARTGRALVFDPRDHDAVTLAVARLRETPAALEEMKSIARQAKGTSGNHAAARALLQLAEREA